MSANTSPFIAIRQKRYRLRKSPHATEWVPRYDYKGKETTKGIVPNWNGKYFLLFFLLNWTEYIKAFFSTPLGCCCSSRSGVLLVKSDFNCTSNRFSSSTHSEYKNSFFFESGIVAALYSWLLDLHSLYIFSVILWESKADSFICLFCDSDGRFIQLLFL